ncbi:hypothetical protein F5X98DRAFT_382686 [Xylaria grammica]|nr:hypothetical protein F5X98DRAFT_382686 [Xylaria grammica]
MTLRCREVLRANSIAIEVEVCEGKHQRNAISADLESQIDETICPLSPYISTWNPNAIILPMLPYSGYPVGYLKGHFSWVTIGLHVMLGDNSKVYGLTCRHMLDRSQPLDRSCNGPTESQKQYHIHGADRIVTDTLGKLGFLKESMDCVLRKLKRKKKNGGKSLEKAKDSANSEKIIGHVAFYPSHETSTRTPGYSKDWASMEPDKNKYPKGFQNKVFISDIPPQKQGGRIAQKWFVVAKRGATSGMAFGETSAIEAVVRELGRDGKHYVFRELLIVPLDGRGQLSKVGDSGSCVFGKDDGVIGMVVGSDGVLERGLGGGEVMPEKEAQSKGMKQWHDYDDDDAVGITFATPIDWIFDDIWDLTGFKPRLLGYPK